MAKPMKRSTRHDPPGLKAFETEHPIPHQERKLNHEAHPRPKPTPPAQQTTPTPPQDLPHADTAQPLSQLIPQDMPVDCPDTFAWLLKHHLKIELRYNQRWLCNEYRVIPDTTWKRNVDSFRNEIRIQLRRRCHYQKQGTRKNEPTQNIPYKLSKEAAADFSDMLSTDNRADDVADFFDGLEGVWDGNLRIEQTLQDHLDAENNEITTWASAFQFVGCVLATQQPGIHRRGIITLIGHQLSGKTTWILSLLPQHLRQYAAPVSLAGEDEQRSHRLVGMALIELGELAGASRADNDSLKSWLTRPFDHVRLPWRRDPERIERSGLMMASINENQKFPDDSSGSTRWVGIPCPGSCNVEAIPDKLRIQWWAEAVAVTNNQHPTLTLENYEKGIPRNLLQQQAEQNKPFERRDETVENMLTEAEFQIGHKDKAIDIAKHIGFLPMQYSDGTSVTTFASQREQRQFTAELEKNGWKQHRYRVQGKIVKGWKYETNEH